MGKNFDFKEYENYVKKIESISQGEFKLFLKQFLLEMAQRVVARAKPRTPVDTGYLRNSIGIENQKIVQHETEATNKRTGHHLAAIDTSNSDIDSIALIGDELQVTIVAGAEYASFIEYGHPYKNGRMYPGRYMITLSVNEIQEQIPKRFDSQFKQFLQNRGVG